MIRWNQFLGCYQKQGILERNWTIVSEDEANILYEEGWRYV